MEVKELKSYKGFIILKSFDYIINANGSKIQSNISYMAETSDGNNFDCNKTLKGLKESIDKYLS